MPKGPGTYGSKVGRPPKKKRKKYALAGDVEGKMREEAAIAGAKAAQAGTSLLADEMPVSPYEEEEINMDLTREDDISPIEPGKNPDTDESFPGRTDRIQDSPSPDLDERDIEANMESDETIEEDYLDFIINEALDEEDEIYLYEKLQADPRLSTIFDRVFEVGTEFAGSGPVEGPGTAMSDSIPARLSPGEFVINAKATKEMGPENLQRAMEEAEAMADARERGDMPGVEMRQARRTGGYMTKDVREGMNVDAEKIYEIDKEEVDDTNKRINDSMIHGGVPIR